MAGFDPQKTLGTIADSVRDVAHSEPLLWVGDRMVDLGNAALSTYDDLRSRLSRTFSPTPPTPTLPPTTPTARKPLTPPRSLRGRR